MSISCLGHGLSPLEEGRCETPIRPKRCARRADSAAPGDATCFGQMVHHFPMIARAQDGGSGVRPSVRGVDRPPLSRAELEVRIHLPPALQRGVRCELEASRHLADSGQGVEEPNPFANTGSASGSMYKPGRGWRNFEAPTRRPLPQGIRADSTRELPSFMCAVVPEPMILPCR
jgi:hypothetical protein